MIASVASIRACAVRLARWSPNSKGARSGVAIELLRQGRA